MEILHINSYYSGSHFYKNFYDKQVELGLSIDVYVPINKSISVKNKDFGDFTKISRNHSKGDRFLFHLKHKKIYKDITQNYITKKYDIIHAHSLFSNGYIAYRLKEKYGIPYIVTVRNTDVNTFFKKMIHLRK
ncbi:MAG TPA: glycosyltransferase, partial [Ureibacillus sp.]|nr:glycosyltransferase [Ureibacillus sp.]